MKLVSLRIRPIATLLFVIFISGVSAQNSVLTDTVKKSSFLKKHVKVSGVFYLAGQYKQKEDNKSFNFMVRRAYITVKANFTKNLSVRYTQDITIDDEGDDAGNIELRIKYLYIQYKIPDFTIFTDNHLRFGIVQRPWLDFEEHVNAYRVQGSMFMERSGLFNSAGFGVSYEGYFGGRLTGDYMKKIHPNNPGKYGSFSFGLFNGGGYHKFEKNISKNFEARVTIRPLPVYLPGLQFSYIGLFGKGNIAKSPVFQLNAGYISYENLNFTLTAQYEKGRGNSFGTFVDSSFRALPHHGFSIYGEVKIPKSDFAFFARYDNFKLEGEFAGDTKRQIYGASWRFYRQNKIVFSYQNGDIFGNTKARIYDLAIDVSF